MNRYSWSQTFICLTVCLAVLNSAISCSGIEQLAQNTHGPLVRSLFEDSNNILLQLASLQQQGLSSAADSYNDAVAVAETARKTAQDTFNQAVEAESLALEAKNDAVEDLGTVEEAAARDELNQLNAGLTFRDGVMNDSCSSIGCDIVEDVDMCRKAVAGLGMVLDREVCQLQSPSGCFYNPSSTSVDPPHRPRYNQPGCSASSCDAADNCICACPDKVVTLYSSTDCDQSEALELVVRSSDFRGGRHAAGWDTCQARWADGSTMSSQDDAAGQAVGSFRVSSGFEVSTSNRCHDGFRFDTMPLLTTATSSSGCVSTGGAKYFQFARPGSSDYVSVQETVASVETATKAKMSTEKLHTEAMKAKRKARLKLSAQTQSLHRLQAEEDLFELPMCPTPSLSHAVDTSTAIGGAASWTDVEDIVFNASPHTTTADNSMRHVQIFPTKQELSRRQYGLGNSSVAFNAIDSSGNMDSCKMTVVVVQRAQPLQTPVHLHAADTARLSLRVKGRRRQRRKVMAGFKPPRVRVRRGRKSKK